MDILLLLSAESESDQLTRFRLWVAYCAKERDLRIPGLVNRPTWPDRPCGQLILVEQ